MDINTIVLIIILAVLLYAMVNNSQEKRLNAKKQKERIAAEKAEDSKGGNCNIWPSTRT